MFLKVFPVSLLVFLGIDFLWLAFIARNFYGKYLGHLMAKNPNLAVALLFYLIFTAGLVIFVITPALEKRSLLQALLLGALFGLVSYSTYDLTNLATLKDWPVIVTIVDLIWGSFLSAAVSVVTYSIIQKIGL